MKVILGLGNPGSRYIYSRHNLGFLIVEKLAKANKIRLRQRAFNCLLGEGSLGNQKVLLAKPQTFVNLSAQAFVPIIKQKRIKLADVLVICDDVNLPLGKIRIRPRGTDGGHKGLRSIIEALGSNNFARLRIGVGRKRRGKLCNFVLGRFSRTETKVMAEVAEVAAACSETWVKEGIQSAMNSYN